MSNLSDKMQSSGFGIVIKKTIPKKIKDKPSGLFNKLLKYATTPII